MVRRDAGKQGLGDTILAFLRQRGEAASSHMLAERFLKASVGSEEIATRMLRPILETMGAVYHDDEGWVLVNQDVGAASTPSSTFVAVIEPDAVRVHLVPVQGQSALKPLPPGTRLPADMTLIMLEPRLRVSAVRQWFRDKGLPAPVAVHSLRSAVRGVIRIPRQAGLSEICAALGVRWLDTEDPEGIAVAMAACVAEASARRDASEDDDAGDTAVAIMLPSGITSEMLAALPESPGVYRFHDADGGMLYVGKAANLRRRVSSYFTPAAARRPRRFQHLIQTMTYEVMPSELEALLKEARLIDRRAPAGNIQVLVHERVVRYDSARAFALLLPDASAHVVSVVLVRDGVYLGHARIGPRGGGVASARKLLGRAVCGKPAGQRARPAADRDTAILRSWLARNGESVSRLDLDGFTKADQAGDALIAAVKALLAEPGTAVFR